MAAHWTNKEEIGGYILEQVLKLMNGVPIKRLRVFFIQPSQD